MRKPCRSVASIITVTAAFTLSHSAAAEDTHDPHDPRFELGAQGLSFNGKAGAQATASLTTPGTGWFAMQGSIGAAGSFGLFNSKESTHATGSGGMRIRTPGINEIPPVGKIGGVFFHQKMAEFTPQYSDVSAPMGVSFHPNETGFLDLQAAPGLIMDRGFGTTALYVGVQASYETDIAKILTLAGSVKGAMTFGADNATIDYSKTGNFPGYVQQGQGVLAAASASARLRLGEHAFVGVDGSYRTNIADVAYKSFEPGSVGGSIPAPDQDQGVKHSAELIVGGTVGAYW